MNAPAEMYLGPSVVGGWESPQSVCASTLTVNGVKPVHYLRSDLADSRHKRMIEALRDVREYTASDDRLARFAQIAAIDSILRESEP